VIFLNSTYIVIRRLPDVNSGIHRWILETFSVSLDNIKFIPIMWSRSSNCSLYYHKVINFTSTKKKNLVFYLLFSSTIHRFMFECNSSKIHLCAIIAYPLFSLVITVLNMVITPRPLQCKCRYVRRCQLYLF